MSDDRELRSSVLSVLQRVAPEVDPGAIDGAAPLRDQVDLDSMDFLNFLISLHDRFRVDIPEADYEQLRSLDDIVAYLRTRVPAS
jgi:acyl carrier protein